MYWIFCFMFVIILHFSETAILRSSLEVDRNLNPVSSQIGSNETHFTWILYPPWKRHTDLFNDKPYNDSVDYFGISKEDHLTNESYIETSKLIVCNEVNLNFYSKVNSSQNNIDLILFIYKHYLWNKEWEYRNNGSQWQLHQLKFNLTDKNEEILLRFLPMANTSDQISIAIAILNITTHTNCENFNPINQSLLQNSFYDRRNSSIHVFLFAIFGSIFLLGFITIMAGFIYGIINKRYNQWRRKRSTGRRKKGRKTRNVIRDESTILGIETDIL